MVGAARRGGGGRDGGPEPGAAGPDPNPDPDPGPNPDPYPGLSPGPNPDPNPDHPDHPDPGPNPNPNPNPQQVQGGAVRPSPRGPTPIAAGAAPPPIAAPAFDRPPQATWAEPPVELPAGPASVPGAAPVRLAWAPAGALPGVPAPGGGPRGVGPPPQLGASTGPAWAAPVELPGGPVAVSWASAEEAWAPAQLAGGGGGGVAYTGRLAEKMRRIRHELGLHDDNLTVTSPSPTPNPTPTETQTQTGPKP